MYRLDVPLVLFLAVLTIYYETLQPSVPGGDAGELVTEAYQLGLAHPPGYPLHTLLGYLASHSPFSIDGTTAARDINFLSSVLGACAGVFIYFTVLFTLSHVVAQHKDTEQDSALLSHFSAVVGAVGFCMSPLVWTYSISAEVFALNNFFASLVTCMIVYVVNSTKQGSYQAQQLCIVGAFVCGLGLTNQHSLVFFVLPTGAVALWWCTVREEGEEGDQGGERDKGDKGEEKDTGEEREEGEGEGGVERKETTETSETKETKEQTNEKDGCDGNTNTLQQTNSDPTAGEQTTKNTTTTSKENTNPTKQRLHRPSYLSRSTFLFWCCTFGAFGLSLYVFYLPYGTGKKGSWGDGTIQYDVCSWWKTFSHQQVANQCLTFLLSCVVSCFNFSLFLLLYTPTGTTIIGFFKHVLRYEYGTFVLHPDMISHESAWERTWIYLRHISTQTSHRFTFTGTAVDSTMTFDPANSVSFTPLSASNWTMYTIILIGVVHSCLTSIGGRVLLLLLASYLLCFHSLSNLDLTTELTFGKGTCR